MIVLAIILLANPVYVDELLIYSTNSDDFYLGHLYHAAITGLGFVMLFGAGERVIAKEHQLDIAVVVTSIAVLSVVAFVLYSWLIAEFIAPGRTGILGAGHRKTFIASLVAAFFVAGAAVAARRPRLLIGVPIVLVAGGLFLALDPSYGFRVGDIVFLAVFHHLLGVPLLGTLLLLAAAVVGGVWGRSQPRTLPA